MKSLKEVLTGVGALHPLRRIRVRAVPFGRVSLFETDNVKHWVQATNNGVMYFCVKFGDQATTATCEVIDGLKVKQVAQIRIWKRTDMDEATEFVMNSDLLNSIRSLAKAHGCNAAIYDEADPNTMYFMHDECDCQHDEVYGDEYMQIYIAFTAQQHEEEEEE